MSHEAAQLYERFSGARIPDALIEDAIELALAELPVEDRDEAADRLQDDDHAAVLRKEVADVVILVTSAMEAPTATVYRDIVALVEPAPFDEITAPFKAALMRKMARDALDEVATADEPQVLDHLQFGLRACGDVSPLVLAPHSSAPQAA